MLMAGEPHESPATLGSCSKKNMGIWFQELKIMTPKPAMSIVYVFFSLWIWRRLWGWGCMEKVLVLFIELLPQNYSHANIIHISHWSSYLLWDKSHVFPKLWCNTCIWEPFLQEGSRDIPGIYEHLLPFWSDKDQKFKNLPWEILLHQETHRLFRLFKGDVALHLPNAFWVWRMKCILTLFLRPWIYPRLLNLNSVPKSSPFIFFNDTQPWFDLIKSNLWKCPPQNCDFSEQICFFQQSAWLPTFPHIPFLERFGGLWDRWKLHGNGSSPRQKPRLRGSLGGDQTWDPVTVTTRIITFLVGNPNLNLHLPLVLGGG